MIEATKRITQDEKNKIQALLDHLEEGCETLEEAFNAIQAYKKEKVVSSSGLSELLEDSFQDKAELEKLRIEIDTIDFLKKISDTMKACAIRIDQIRFSKEIPLSVKHRKKQLEKIKNG